MFLLSQTGSSLSWVENFRYPCSVVVDWWCLSWQKYYLTRKNSCTLTSKLCHLVVIHAIYEMSMRRSAFGEKRRKKIWNTNSYQLVVIITIIIILEALYYHLYCLYMLLHFAAAYMDVSFSKWSQQTCLYSRVKCLSVSSHLHSKMSSVNNFPSAVIVFLVLICRVGGGSGGNGGGGSNHC